RDAARLARAWRQYRLEREAGQSARRRWTVFLGADVELLHLVEERRPLHSVQAARGLRLVAAVRAERVHDPATLLRIARATEGADSGPLPRGGDRSAARGLEVDLLGGQALA